MQFKKKNCLIKDKTLKFTAKGGPDEKILEDIYKILVLNLGEPPEIFKWRYENGKGEVSEYKTWTPRMALMGVDTTALGVTTKWLLENSWGEKSGHKGFLIMTDDWFSEYMFRMVVPTQFVSQQVIDISRQKATMLPPWDPMYAPLYQ